MKPKSRTKTFRGFFIITLLFSVEPFIAAQQTYEFPYQNTGLSVEVRVNDLVGRMTAEEKISQMMNNAPSIERLGIPAYNWWNECLHGVAEQDWLLYFPRQ